MTERILLDPAQAVDRVLKGDVSRRSMTNFRQKPYSLKVIELEKAVVPPKADNTADSISLILKTLIAKGAVQADEFAPLYSTLLDRVKKYNGLNVQQNLEQMLEDVRGAKRALLENQNLKSAANAAVLSNFLLNIPQTVQSGQQNFEGMKKNLKLLSQEGINVTVYRSGSVYFLQAPQSGPNAKPLTVDLNDAFENLFPYWGAMLHSTEIPSNLAARLSVNTRMLILLTAPFSSPSDYIPDSFINALNILYLETVQDLVAGEENTEREIRQLTAVLPTNLDGPGDIKQTLNALLRGVESEPPGVNRVLSPREEAIVRYAQKFLTQQIEGEEERLDPILALDQLNLSFPPDMYHAHRGFIQRLMDYFRKALIFSPDYFRQIYSNKYWSPPASFWLRDFDATIFPATDHFDDYEEDWGFTRQDENELQDLERDRQSVAGATPQYEEDEDAWLTDSPLPRLNDEVFQSESSYYTFDRLAPKGASSTLVSHPVPRPYAVYSVPPTSDSLFSRDIPAPYSFADSPLPLPGPPVRFPRRDHHKRYRSSMLPPARDLRSIRRERRIQRETSENDGLRREDIQSVSRFLL